MLALIITIAILVYFIQRFLCLLFFGPDKPTKPVKVSPSPLEKLISETFEHTALSPPDAPRVLIFYGTEYGFARDVARKLAASLASAGYAPRVVNVLNYRVVDFTKEFFMAFVCSTTGDGVPPNEAADLRAALIAKDIVLPSTCRFAVLALGDRAYAHFCRAGIEFDELLGDARLLDRVEVDQEDWTVINDWIAALEKVLKENVEQMAQQTAVPQAENDYLQAALKKYARDSENRTDARYSRNEPFMATVVGQQLLTAPKTGHKDDKEVIRVEFDIAKSGIQYECGDALGVVPRNNPEYVDRLLCAMASTGDEIVWTSENAESVSFTKALTEQLDLRSVKPDLVLVLAKKCTDTEELALAKRVLGCNPDEVAQTTATLSEWGKTYLAQREVFDVLSDFASVHLSSQGLVELLRPLHARYYSISSTPVASPERIAITVDVLRYTSLNVEREGVASTYLKDRCRLNETKVGVFISRNPNFRLPVDGRKPIIMIGPGTGIAPFIGFIEQRLREEASGQNWLFFGCRHEKQDFLYAEQLQEFARREKILLHTAFSRDGPEKIYVQNRMAELAAELWRLIQDEMAHVYVCGDGGQMADDVDAELRNIVQSVGGMSETDTERYMHELTESSRYQRDVWVA